MDDANTPQPGDETASGSATATLEPPAPPAAPPATGAAAAPEPGDGRKRRWWLPVAIVVLLAIVVGGGWFGYRQSTARKLAADRLATATTLVEQADATVISIDEIVRAEISAEIGTKAAELTPTVEPAVTDLEDAVDLIDQAAPDLTDDRTSEAQALKAAAEARIEMLGYAPTILDANIAAAQALTLGTEGWDLVLAGETLADKAVVEYNKLTKDSVTKSKKLTEESQAKFTDAKKKFTAAGAAFPDAAFDPYLAYIDAKLGLLAISVKADQAFLKSDNVAANKLSDQYNTKEKDVVAKAKKLPDTPAAPVATAYETVAGEATTSYFDARSNATKADKILKDLDG